MDNLINIQPVNVNKPVEKIQLLLSGFQLHQTEMDVYVTMYTADNTFVETKTVHIPPTIYKDWGTDDTYIEDYVISQLNLSKVEPDPLPRPT